MLILELLWGIGFYAVVLFGLGKDFLFKSILGRCDNIREIQPSSTSTNFSFRGTFNKQVIFIFVDNAVVIVGLVSSLTFIQVI